MRLSQNNVKEKTTEISVRHEKREGLGQDLQNIGNVKGRIVHPRLTESIISREKLCVITNWRKRLSKKTKRRKMTAKGEQSDLNRIQALTQSHQDLTNELIV